MISVTSAQKGNTVRVYLETYDDNDNRTDADSAPILYIKKGDSALVTPLVDGVMMSKVDLGGYEYLWDTKDAPLGPYDITTVYTMDGIRRVAERAFYLARLGVTIS